MTLHRRSAITRSCAIVASTLCLAVVANPAAHAMPSLSIIPPVASGPVPDPGPVAPLEPTRQATTCATMVATRSDFVTPPAGFAALDVSAAWKFSRGEGQKIAIIDTGVFRHPRLSVIAGGDYVSTSDGTRDCDGHGTIVAGIAAAKDSKSDGFAGVAPDAQVLAIRQTSESYSPESSSQSKSNGQLTQSGYGNVTTLAKAVVRAVRLGATVVNISEAACQPIGQNVGDTSLGAALRYAYQRNVVVVAAAGNVSTNDPGCKTQNPGASGAADQNSWASVSTQSSPSYFQPYVMSVGAVGPDGQPTDFSLAGPWVSVAAPGTDATSLNTSTRPALVNAFAAQGKTSPIGGTSFAAPYVAGLAALVKARFPKLSAPQVMNRIMRTAHHPSDGHDDSVGFGVIDPVAALTTTTPDSAATADPRTVNSRDIYAASPVAPPRAEKPHLGVPQYVSIAVTAGAVAFGISAWLLIRRRANHRTKLVEGIDY